MSASCIVEKPLKFISTSMIIRTTRLKITRNFEIFIHVLGILLLVLFIRKYISTPANNHRNKQGIHISTVFLKQLVKSGEDVYQVTDEFCKFINISQYTIHQ